MGRIAMESPDPDLLPPALAVRYQALCRLGSGSFGRVVLARDAELDRHVAIKVMRESLPDLEMRLRFEREGRITSRLHHPHVVKVYDTGFVGSGVPYIVYEFVAGRSLAERIAAGPVEAARAVEWGRQLAGALDAAHEAGVLHRDLKPANVLIRDDGAAVLCDFGIARFAAGGTVQTREGIVLGTPEYMAPELFEGQPPSAASDQFSLAATLFHAAYGEGPYGTAPLKAILEAARSGPPFAPPPGRAGAAPALDSALAKALDREPDRRFVKLKDFERALVRTGATTVVVPVQAQAPVPEPDRPAAFGPGSLAALVLGTVVVLATLRDPPDSLRADRGDQGQGGASGEAVLAWVRTPGDPAEASIPREVWTDLDGAAPDLDPPIQADLPGRKVFAAVLAGLRGEARGGEGGPVRRLARLLDVARGAAGALPGATLAVRREAVLVGWLYRLEAGDPGAAEALLDGSRLWMQGLPPAAEVETRSLAALLLGLRAEAALRDLEPGLAPPVLAAVGSLAATKGFAAPYGGLLATLAARLHAGALPDLPDPMPERGRVVLLWAGREAAETARKVAGSYPSEWDDMNRLLGKAPPPAVDPELVRRVLRHAWGAAAAAVLLPRPELAGALVQASTAERLVLGLGRAPGPAGVAGMLGPRLAPGPSARRALAAVEGLALLREPGAPFSAAIDPVLVPAGMGWISDAVKPLGSEGAAMLAALEARVPPGSLPALAFEGRGLMAASRQAEAAGPFADGLDLLLGALAGAPAVGGPGWELVDQVAGWAWSAGQWARAWPRLLAGAEGTRALLGRAGGGEGQVLQRLLAAKTLLRRAEALRGAGRPGELAALDPELRALRDAPPDPALGRAAERVLAREALPVGVP